MEGRNFGDVPLNLELKLEVWDSPNSAGVIIDAVRCAKVALDRGIGGPLIAPSAYFMKSPPVQYHDDEAYRMVEAFAAGDPAPSGRRTEPLHPPRSTRGLIRLAHHASRRRPASSSPRGPSSRRAPAGSRGARPTARPGGTPRCSMTWRPSSSGRMRVELLLAPAAPRCAPRARPCGAEGPGPSRVAGGAVTAGQLVQLVEQRSGVADVTADGPVGPSEPVGVEAQVELDQPGDDLDVVLRSTARP